MHKINCEKKYIEYEFKILYAFTIIFIVMSHCFNGGVSLFNEFFPFPSFAISPFIFASGYFYKAKYEANILEFIIKKVKVYIIPLFLWNFFYSLLMLVLKEYDFYPYEKVSLYTFFISPITNGLQYSLTFGSWFLVSLFMVHVFNICIRKIFRILNIKINEILYFISFLLLGVIGVLLSTKGYNSGIFLILDRFLFFLPFFAMGTLYQKYKRYDKLSNFKYFSMIIIVSLIIIYFYGEMPYVKVNIAELESPFILMPYITGILGTLFWLRIAKILKPAIGHSKYINILADNTLIIMINQFLGFKIAGLLFAILHYLTPFCSNFNMYNYKTMWNYYYLPHNLNQMLIIYLFFGISIPLLMQKMIIMLKNKIINTKMYSTSIKKSKNINIKSIDAGTMLFLLTMLIYIVGSLVVISSRIPYFDEINAWNIAANCNFFELLEVCKHEGHFMLWYLLIKPFAANNIGFPLSMFIINWIFAFLAVIILWLRAPFNPWIKMLITFSLPIHMFSVYARCYAIGMFFLFLICSIYPKRKNHPIIYPTLILLLANTSVMGTIAGFVLGLLYLYELFKDRVNKQIDTKTLLKPAYIFILCIVMILIQIMNFKIPIYSLNKDYRLLMFFETFQLVKYLPKDFVWILLFSLLLTGVKFFVKDVKPYLFFVFSTAIIIYVGFNIYALAWWHYMFLFLFLVVAVWMYMDKFEIKTNFQKLYYVLFCCLCFWFIFFFKYPWYWNGFHLPTVNYIKENISQYDNSNIFLFPTDSSIIGVVPSLYNYNIAFFDLAGNSYKSADAYIEQWGNNAHKIDFDGIKRTMLSRKEIHKNYLFVAVVEENKHDDELFIKELEHNNTDLRFIPYKKLNDVIIYLIVFDGHYSNANQDKKY